MSYFRYLFLAFLCFCGVAACERVDLEDQSKPKKDTPSEHLPIDTTSSDDVYMIGQAPAFVGKEVMLVGYIVGCVEGTSLSKARFVAPFSFESNLLLADTPTERSAEACLPIALPANTNVRAELNLKNNPTLIGRRVIVLGKVEAYFQRAGIRMLRAYELLDASTEPTPTLPVDTTQKIEYPTVDSTRIDTLISRSRRFTYLSPRF